MFDKMKIRSADKAWMRIRDDMRAVDAKMAEDGRVCPDEKEVLRIFRGAGIVADSDPRLRPGNSMKLTTAVLFNTMKDLVMKEAGDAAFGSDQYKEIYWMEAERVLDR